MEKQQRPVKHVELEPELQALQVEDANDYCENTCPARDSLLPRGLACPFIIRQALGHTNIGPREFHVIKNAAQNTWIHCVSDVKRGDEPVILLHSGQISYPWFEEHLQQ